MKVKNIPFLKNFILSVFMDVLSTCMEAGEGRMRGEKREETGGKRGGGERVKGRGSRGEGGGGKGKWRWERGRGKGGGGENGWRGRRGE